LLVLLVFYVVSFVLFGLSLCLVSNYAACVFSLPILN
jgi:hypothetical protein